MWRRQKKIFPAENQIPDHAAHSLGTTLAVLNILCTVQHYYSLFPSNLFSSFKKNHHSHIKLVVIINIDSDVSI